MSVEIASPYRYSHTVGMMAHGGRGFSLPMDMAVGPDGVFFSNGLVSTIMGLGILALVWPVVSQIKGRFLTPAVR